MARYAERRCDVCGSLFTPRTARHRFDTAACRSRGYKQGLKVERAAEPSSVSASALVESVTAELEAAGVVDGFAGQLAITLASRLAKPDETGASALSKELRTVMEAALTGKTLPAADDPEPEDDELEKARRARESKARQAAGRA